MNNDNDHYEWWVDADSESDLDVLDSEYDGDVIDDEDEFLGFLTGVWAAGLF